MFLIPQRVVVSLMGFWAVLLAYTIRTALSFAITRMAVPKKGGESLHECVIDEGKNMTTLQGGDDVMYTN